MGSALEDEMRVSIQLSSIGFCFGLGVQSLLFRTNALSGVLLVCVSVVSVWKCSFSRSRLQKVLMSVSSCVELLFGVGVNFKPFLSRFICGVDNVLFDMLIINGCFCVGALGCEWLVCVLCCVCLGFSIISPLLTLKNYHSAVSFLSASVMDHIGQSRSCRIGCCCCRCCGVLDIAVR